jgi:hypothetical protein
VTAPRAAARTAARPARARPQRAPASSARVCSTRRLAGSGSSFCRHAYQPAKPPTRTSPARLAWMAPNNRICTCCQIRLEKSLANAVRIVVDSLRKVGLILSLGRVWLYLPCILLMCKWIKSSLGNGFSVHHYAYREKYFNNQGSFIYV